MARRVTTESTVVDQVSGEVLDHTKTIEYTYNVKNEDFFMVFFKNLASLYQLHNATEIHVLAFMCSRATFNTNKVSMTAGKRKECMAEIKIKPQTLSNALTSLSNKGLITGTDGEYVITPELMWKGSTQMRNKWLKEKGLTVTLRFKAEKE